MLAEEAALVRGEFADVAATLRREIAVDAGFAAFASLCLERGAELTIVSSGVEAIVRDRLDEFGLGHVAVVANELIPDPGGWRVIFRDGVDNGTDKAALVRAAALAGRSTVFIGDGRSDYDAAVAADLRFAKRGRALAHYLERRGIAFEIFDRFADVTERLG